MCILQLGTFQIRPGKKENDVLEMKKLSCYTKLCFGPEHLTSLSSWEHVNVKSDYSNVPLSFSDLSSCFGYILNLAIWD